MSKITPINITALKKNLSKHALNYYTIENDVIMWSNSGTFAIKCNKLFFEIEIQAKTPTQAAPSLPTCIINILDSFKNSQPEILTHTFLTMNINNMNCYLFQNIKYKYITPINNDVLNIIKNIEDFTPYQLKQNFAILFKNDFFDIILMPVRNDEIKEKLIDIAETLKQ